MSWTIQQTAEITGIPADTLRYYEKEGMISPERRDNGYRQYSEDDIALLKNIVVMKYAHFTLTEMKNMEELFNREPSEHCNEVSKHILKAKISQLNKAIYNYQKIVRLMEELLPMVDSVTSYQNNKREIDEFISQIFDDIQKEQPLMIGNEE